MTQLCRGTALIDIQQMDYQAFNPLAHPKHVYLTQFDAFHNNGCGFPAN
jgi:hypothetical protein